MRLAFDASLPAVVSVPEMDVGSVRLVGGEAFDWRALGVTEQTLAELWRAGFVAFVSPAPPPPLAAPAASPVTVQRAEEPVSRRRR